MDTSSGETSLYGEQAVASLGLMPVHEALPAFEDVDVESTRRGLEPC